MDFVFIVGRVLFALLFIGSGIGHFRALEAMTGYAKYKKVPAAKASVIGSGLLILAGAVSVALGIYPALGALALVIFLVPTAFLMHGFWNETDPQSKMNEQIAFNKDIALAGAALVLFYIFSTATNLPLILVK